VFITRRYLEEELDKLGFKSLWEIFLSMMISLVAILLKLNYFMIFIPPLTSSIMSIIVTSRKMRRIKMNKIMRIKTMRGVGLLAAFACLLSISPLLLIYILEPKVWISWLFGMLLCYPVYDLVTIACIRVFETIYKIKVYRFYILDQEGRVIESGIKVKPWLNA